MRRILLAAAVGAALGAGGLALAQQGYRGPEKVRPLSERDIAETLDGKEARVTMAEVTFEPGQAGLPHRHPGPIFGYVLEGEFGLGEDPPKTLKAGVKFPGKWHGFFYGKWRPARSVSELTGPVEFQDFDSETGIGAGSRGTKAEVEVRGFLSQIRAFLRRPPWRDEKPIISGYSGPGLSRFGSWRGAFG